MKYNKLEFRAACGGISRQYLDTYIRREQVIVGSDGMIDDENEINNAFLIRLQQKNGVVPVSDVAPQKKKSAKKAPQATKIEKPQLEIELTPPKPSPIRTAPIQQPIHEPGNISQMEREMKELELEKKREDLEITKIKKQKLQGEVIPVDLVKGVIHRYSKSITDTYNQGAENFLEEIRHRFKINDKEFGPWKTKWYDVLNEAVMKAIDITEIEIKGIVNEYSETRGKGERK